jgi:hypothetical protein
VLALIVGSTEQRAVRGEKEPHRGQGEETHVDGCAKTSHLCLASSVAAVSVHNVTDMSVASRGVS